MDSDVQTGHWQYVAPVDGYVEKVIVSPHASATSGTVGLQWKNQSGNISTEVNGTISQPQVFQQPMNLVHHIVLVVMID